MSTCAKCAKRDAVNKLVDKLDDGDMERLNIAFENNREYHQDKETLRVVLREAAERE